ncbi:MAG TPA: tRNA (adenosine(37)-N6)-threonylcarbamoyltransferase complex ATPase subunit type 1 TsaE [Candidatus Baltobacteraceae bacterium]|nr:tRNA (adenosine(37)-N6)-threonylcarbamoyltransferase complex ATPase subunit type 1 TsaE [Candidatus Baltobacteraceae bacterium]
MVRTFTSEAAFRTFASDFARSLKAGDVVGLSGPLGAGKTTFVQAAATALLGGDPVSSPTFTFWHRYPSGDTAAPVDHIDLYRIDDPAEIVELGLDDAFEGGSIVFVEWWQNAGGRLPAPSYEIVIAGKGEDPRTVTVISK